MTARTHRLKCWPTMFRDVASGKKAFEVRRNDRDFDVGDELILNEYHPNGSGEGEYTRKTIAARVTYILRGAKGLADGFVVLGIELQNGGRP